MTLKVYFKTLGTLHSGFWDLINYPPEGYEFVTDGGFVHKSLTTALSSPNILGFLKRVIPLRIAKVWLDEIFRKIPKNINLIYAYNHIIFKKMNWVVQVEFAHSFTDLSFWHFERFRKLVERKLVSNHCKKIITLSKFSKNSIMLNFNSRDFEEKIEIVPPAVHKKNFVKDYVKKGEVRLLFVGSINTPNTFEPKGGRELLEAFSIISKKYENLKLVIRAKIPQHIKDVYKVENNPKIKLIEEKMPWKLLEQEFINADIFLYPTHQAHNFVILDAMSYGLPVITTEIGSTGRIEDGVTGFVISKRPPLSCAVELVRRGYQIYGFVSIEEILRNHTTLNRNECIKAIRDFENEVVQELVEKTSILIENPKLRRRMGEKARWEIEHGKFSIEERNRKLKRIFDEAIEK